MRIGMTMAMPVVGQRFPLPTQMGGANLVLWLRADQGVTLSSASVSNDTLATWSMTASGTRVADTDPAGGAGAVKYTDGADGAPTNHGFSRAPTNAQTGPSFVEFWLRPGNLLTWARITLANSGHWIYLDLTNGVVGSNSGAGDLMSAIVVLTVGTWRKWRIYTQSASGNETCICWFAKADGGASYQGDGTGTAFIGTGATYGPVLTQERASAWDDQSGNGNNATQATAGNQPLVKCYDAAGNWVPYGQGSGWEIGWPLNAAAKLLSDNTIAAAFAGDGKPYTVLELRNLLGVQSAGGNAGLILIGAVASTTLGRNVLTFTHTHKDDAALSKTQTAAAFPSVGYKSIAYTYDGTSGRIYVDEVADATNPTNLDVGVETHIAANIYFTFEARREVAMFNSVLSDTDRKRVENGMRVRCGWAPI